MKTKVFWEAAEFGLHSVQTKTACGGTVHQQITSRKNISMIMPFLNAKQIFKKHKWKKKKKFLEFNSLMPVYVASA